MADIWPLIGHISEISGGAGVALIGTYKWITRQAAKSISQSNEIKSMKEQIEVLTKTKADADLVQLNMKNLQQDVIDLREESTRQHNAQTLKVDAIGREVSTMSGKLDMAVDFILKSKT